MVNILCVKWGTAFDCDYVNKLYSMVSKHFHHTFTFYCFTDAPIGLNKDIIPIELNDEGWIKWWTKITLWNHQVTKNNLNIFFDLDVIIRDDISDLINEETEYLTIIENHWNDPIETLKGLEQNLSCDINSSIMIWRYNQSIQQIYDFFSNNKHTFMKDYKGIDKVLYYYEFDEVNFNTISDKWVCSYHHGKDENQPVVIFNQGNKQKDINDKELLELWN